MGLWLLTNDGSSMSMLLSLAGVGVLALAVMLFFFSPSGYVRDTVCDAMAVSDVLTVNKILSSLLVSASGIYVPGEGGDIKLFIPVSGNGDVDLNAIRPGPDVFDVKGSVKGVSLTPPGFGLYQHAVGMGAAFTPEGLESEIKDVVENGLELAASAGVKRDGRLVIVSLRGPLNRGMCRSIRAGDPGVCARTGCPMCSFVGCMIAAGTGSKVRLEGASVDDKGINLTYELI